MKRSLLGSVLLALVASAPAPVLAQEVPEGAMFVASSRGSVYYWVGCSAWRRLSEANRIFFESRAEAIEAGYRASTTSGCEGPADEGPSTNEPLVVRVVDVGPGLCTVTRIPASDRVHYLVYDAGHWTGGRCLAAVREVVGALPIDLLVISHSDSDHLGDADEILDQFVVESALTTGFERTTASWQAMRDALAAVEAGGADVRRLTEEPLVPGETLRIGDAVITLVAGWDRWSLTEGLTTAERRNVVSIVIRVEYAGSSIIYTGDTIGKRLTDGDDACKDAEMVMVGRHDAQEVSLDSDVMIAAHHGGNNGNAACFIEAISPSAVVFSAGHDHEHPTTAVANRFLAAGVRADSIFRTDRGDDEPGDGHWEPAGAPRCRDARDDDDLEIRIAATGEVTVRYRAPDPGCA